jgi:hypothetical protein
MEIESGDEHHTKAMTTRQGPGTGVLGQATTGNPPTEAGQDDDDGDILALSEKRSGKKRGDLSSTAAAATAIQGKSASRISSPALSAPGSHAPASVARSSVLSKTSSSDSDSDSPSRPNKKARTKGQDRDGGVDDSDDSDDGAKRGELKWRGTKQPVKRVGRRRF